MLNVIQGIKKSKTQLAFGDNIILMKTAKYRVRQKSTSTMKRYNVFNFWSINILKHTTWSTIYLKIRKQWTQLLCLRDSRKNTNKQAYVKYRLHAPAITASCDWLKKCKTQTIGNCFNVNHVVVKPEQHSVSHWSIALLSKNTTLVFSCVHEEQKQPLCSWSSVFEPFCQVFWYDRSTLFSSFS